MSRVMVRSCGLAALTAILLAGCTGRELDPYDQAGMWQPEGVVQGNLAAMVVNPHDLILGRGTAAPSVKQASSAVDRLWKGNGPALTPVPVTKFEVSPQRTAGSDASSGVSTGEQ